MVRHFLGLLIFMGLGVPLFSQTQVNGATQLKNMPYLDVRAFGAVGVTGNCKGSTVDDSTAIQNALNKAAATGPQAVYLPNGYCWPISKHIWVPPFVHFFGVGRTQGYEISSPGSLLIANANFAINQVFPFSQLVWITGDNYTGSYGGAKNTTFGSEVDHMEINCAAKAGCGQIFAVGRQQKSSVHDLVLTGGGVPPTNGANAGYTYGFYEEGVDCNGSTPPNNGCLVAPAVGVVGNPFSGQQGPDYNLEIFPAYENGVASTTFVPWSLQGGSNYTLLKSTVNCDGIQIPYGAYAWGTQMVIQSIDYENCGNGTSLSTAAGGLILGTIPNNNGVKNGADHTFVIDQDAITTIQTAASQSELTFSNLNGAYSPNNGSTKYTLINNASGAPFQFITDSNYCYDATTKNSGPCGVINGYYANSGITQNDNSTSGNWYKHSGSYGGIDLYNGTDFSGFNAQGGINSGATNSMRAVHCGSAYFDTTAGEWRSGGNGGTDYSCVAHLNYGFVGVSSGNPSTPFTESTFESNLGILMGGLNHHVLVGTGFWNPLGPTDGPQSLQVSGGIETDILKVSLPVSGTLSQGTYYGWDLNTGIGETDFINSKGTGAGGFNFYNTGTSTPAAGSWIGQIDSSGNIHATGGFYINSTAGFSGTKTAGSCVLTISGGIITNITGC